MHLNCVAHLCALFASTAADTDIAATLSATRAPNTARSHALSSFLSRSVGNEQIAHGCQAGAPRDHAALRVATEEVVHIPARGRQEDLDNDDLEETAYTVPRIVGRRGPEWPRQVLRRSQHAGMQEDDPAEIRGIMLDGGLSGKLAPRRAST